MADEVKNINKINNIDKNNYINKINVRNLALDVVVDVMDKGDYSDKAIHGALEKHGNLEKRDRAFFTRLCQGTIEYAVQSDYIINLFSKTKVRKMKPVIRGILRMGVYQIMHIMQSHLILEKMFVRAKKIILIQMNVIFRLLMVTNIIIKKIQILKRHILI